MKAFVKYFLLLSIVSVVFTSCGDDEEDTQIIKTGAPVISFDGDTSIYTVKVGRTITIEPKIENDIESTYSWTAYNGEVLGTSKTLSHSWDSTGRVFITFKVVTPYGEDSVEIRVDVADLVPPAISLAVPAGGFELLYGKELELKPVVSNIDEATFLWTVNGEEYSTDKDIVFSSEELGVYEFSFHAENEDGEDSIEFIVTVKNPADLAFSWVFDQTTFNVAKGRYIRLMPFDIENAFDARYIWSIGDDVLQDSESEVFFFDSTDRAVGEYTVTVTMKNSYGTVSQDLTVNVCPEEGYYKRSKTGASDSYAKTVFEFMPAPGQFVNEGFTATTMEEAVVYAEGRLQSGSNYVSLGAWGGYIVVGFDHSIDNSGDYDFQIKGNPFSGSSEPGIVWVMQDENGDGLPNDTWYELKGCEYGASGTIQDYAVTYYFPEAAGMDVAWTDNQGNSGTVDRNIYHTQDYYYPMWVPQTSYTLRGTRLESKSYMVNDNPNNWKNGDFDWGYADNYGISIDMLNVTTNPNHFRISDAVTFDGHPANLQYIDFVKVHTGVQVMAGWLGEVSTEVVYFRDYSMID